MYNIIIYGTGNLAKNITELLNCDEINNIVNIIGYADTYKKGSFLNKRIYSILDLKECKYDKLIIASMYYKEILNSLNCNKISIDNVIVLNDLQSITNDKDDLIRLIIRNMHKKPKFENGHFYSPIPNMNEILEREKEIFNDEIKNIEGVELNDGTQLSLLTEFINYYMEIPFTTKIENLKKEIPLRYYFDNCFYEYSDAIILYSIMRLFKPKKIIEVGSGFSSAAILDINEIFFNNTIECKFIEPYPERLNSILKVNDNVQLIQNRVQEIDINVFEELESGDILFIDSTHVSKCGSDVNRVIFDILPKLKRGVIIHFHDVFYPFEYPNEWIKSGIYWNEAYMLRAFLQYNLKFEIIFFNTYVNKKYKNIIKKSMPMCLKNTGGSLWIRKK